MINIFLLQLDSYVASNQWLPVCLQLKRLHDYEKKLNKQEKMANKRRTKTNSTITMSPKNSTVPRVTRVAFDSGVKLLEAAARNDISEGSMV